MICTRCVVLGCLGTHACLMVMIKSRNVTSTKQTSTITTTMPSTQPTWAALLACAALIMMATSTAADQNVGGLFCLRSCFVLLSRLLCVYMLVVLPPGPKLGHCQRRMHTATRVSYEVVSWKWLSNVMMLIIPTAPTECFFALFPGVCERGLTKSRQ